ncbi:Glycosyltransferase, GT2 family [Yoonia rosea]|uniref:Glycosyltransferase, GT2 family n=1 Tax=Yoonia rosea TaxID=287098 RepID=A0A1R3X8U3_9RHOB|nr:glycosyltransferase [Yoonia rosea]SIT87273.1 Glycosyltransferase, GT2 family [Yoonia rosea]
MTAAPDIAVVVIGRNEGARLIASLASLQGVVSRIVYVDSGSTDNSLQAARDAGAQVVELDLSVPFTAARARNAGFAALDPVPEFVQFIDGDCMVEPDWIDAGAEALMQHEEIGIVTGWRSEIHPDASVYNALADVEWHRPAGDIDACGGDMMVRASVFEKVSGFNPHVIAAEDDEFCIRVRKAHWRVHRLPVRMTLHDADMMRFGQWWQRAVRAGHGFAQVGALHPEHFLRARQRVWVYGAILPLLAVVAMSVSAWFLLPVLGLYVVSYLRTARSLMASGLAPRKAVHHSVFLSLSKFPNLIGLLTYHWRVMRHTDMAIIEYK